jgi:acetyl esterase/lipase
MRDHPAGITFVALIFVVCTLLLEPWSSSAVASAAPAGVVVDRDVRYGIADGVPLLMDVYAPARGPADPPAIVVVHGGGFYTGDKSDGDVSRISGVLAALGYVAFNVNYRLAPDHPFPAANEDVEQAVRAVRRRSAEFGIDPGRIGLLGSSAGSTLAAWVAFRGSGTLDTGDRVEAVVTWSGAFDLPALESQLPPGDARINPVLPGHGYLVPGPALEAEAVAASPITYVDPTDPPILMINSADEHSPLAQPEAMLDAARAAGVAARLVVRPGSAHALSGPELAPYVLQAVTFLDRQLGHDGISFFILGRDRLRDRPKALAVLAVLVLIVAIAALATRRPPIRRRYP